MLWEGGKPLTLKDFIIIYLIYWKKLGTLTSNSNKKSKEKKITCKSINIFLYKTIKNLLIFMKFFHCFCSLNHQWSLYYAYYADKKIEGKI